MTSTGPIPVVPCFAIAKSNVAYPNGPTVVTEGDRLFVSRIRDGTQCHVICTETSYEGVIHIECINFTATKSSSQYPQGPNFALLDEYKEQHIDNSYVATYIERIMEAIADYDQYIRGKNSGMEVLNQLRILDKVTPLAELPEIFTETHSMFKHSSLLLLLRSMFNVSPLGRLNEKVTSIGPDVRLLPLSVVIRASLAHLVQREIFEILDWETEHIKAAQLKSLENFHGAETAAKLVQYIGLLALKENSFQQLLDIRAHQLATNFYDILYTLTHWLPYSPNNIKQEHIKKLVKVARESLAFAAELKARIGIFTFYLSKSGEHYDPAVYEVDTASQSEVTDKELPRTNIDMRQQTIACAVMCGVRRTMPGKDKEDLYVKAKVVLRTPFVK